MQQPVEKLLYAVGKLIAKKRILDFTLSSSSEERTGTLEIIFPCNTFSLKRKIYYNRNNFVETNHNLEKHIAAIYLQISDATPITRIEQEIETELRNYAHGMWAEAKAEEIFEKLVLNKKIQSFKRATAEEDIRQKFDFVITLLDGTVMKIDVTTDKKHKKENTSDVYVVLLRESFSREEQLDCIARLIHGSSVYA